MGLCKTSIFSIFIFINGNDLKFCTRFYSRCVYRLNCFKCLNGKVCKMMTSQLEFYWEAILSKAFQVLIIHRSTLVSLCSSFADTDLVITCLIFQRPASEETLKQRAVQLKTGTCSVAALED